MSNEMSRDILPPKYRSWVHFCKVHRVDYHALMSVLHKSVGKLERGKSGKAIKALRKIGAKI